MRILKLAAAVAFMLTSTQSIAATIGIFGAGGHGPGYGAVLTAHGHNATNITAAQAEDVGFLSGFDLVILSRRAGTVGLKNYVENGGNLVTEWFAADWTLNEANLLAADGQVGFSPSTFVGTNTPITFTAAGIASGLSAGISTTYSDAGSTQFFWPITNIGHEIEILATRAGGEPVIIAGASGAGHVLLMAHDWNDRAYDPSDGIELNEQLLLNAVSYRNSTLDEVAPVPLPASLPLLLVGLSLLGLIRHKWRA